MQVTFNILHNNKIITAACISVEEGTIKDAFSKAVADKSFPYPQLFDYTKIGTDNDGFTFKDITGGDLVATSFVSDGLVCNAIPGKNNYKTITVTYKHYDNILKCLEFDTSARTVALKENYENSFKATTEVTMTLNGIISRILDEDTYGKPLVGRYIKTSSNIVGDGSAFFIDDINMFDDAAGVQFFYDILTNKGSLTVQCFYPAVKDNVLVLQYSQVTNILDDGEVLYTSPRSVVEWGPTSDGNAVAINYSAAPTSTWKSYQNNLQITNGAYDVSLIERTVDGAFNVEWYSKKDGVSYPYPANTILIKAKAQPKKVQVTIAMYADGAAVADEEVTDEDGNKLAWSYNKNSITTHETVAVDLNATTSTIDSKYSYKTSKITKTITPSKGKATVSTYLFNRLTKDKNENAEIASDTVFNFKKLIDYNFAFRAIFVACGGVTLNIKARLYSWREKWVDYYTVTPPEDPVDTWSVESYYQTALEEERPGDIRVALPSGYRLCYTKKLESGFYWGEYRTEDSDESVFGKELAEVKNVNSIPNVTLEKDDESDPTLWEWILNHYSLFEVTNTEVLNRFMTHCYHTDNYERHNIRHSLYGNPVDIDTYSNTPISSFINGDITDTNINIYINIIEPIQIKVNWDVRLYPDSILVTYDNTKLVYYKENNGTYKNFVTANTYFNNYIKGKYSIKNIMFNTIDVTSESITYTNWKQDNFYQQRKTIDVYLDNLPEQTQWVAGDGLFKQQEGYGTFAKYILKNVSSTPNGSSYSNDKLLMDGTIFKNGRVSGCKMYLMSDTAMSYSKPSSNIYGDSFTIKDGEDNIISTPISYNSTSLNHGVRATDLFMAANVNTEYKWLREGLQLYTMDKLVTSRSMDDNDKRIKRFAIALTAGGGGGGGSRWWLFCGDQPGGGGSAASTIVAYVDLSEVMVNSNSKWYIVVKDGHRGEAQEAGHDAILVVYVTNNNYPTSAQDAADNRSSEVVCQITCPGGKRGEEKWHWGSTVCPSSRPDMPTIEIKNTNAYVYPLIKFRGIAGNGNYEKSQINDDSFIRVKDNDLTLDSDGTALTTFLDVSGPAFGNLNSKGLNFRRNNSSIMSGQIGFIYQLYDACIFRDIKQWASARRPGDSIWQQSAGMGGMGAAVGGTASAGRDGMFIIFY